MGKNYWMVVESLNNHTITRERGLEVIGFGQPFRRRVQRMQRGDMVLFYVSTTRKWTATATISSEHFEDYAPIWEPTSRGEQYPFRVNLLPDIRLNEGQYIDAMLLAPRLDYLRRWTPEDWPLAFMERLHLIPQKDFRLIEGEMYRVTGRRQPPLKQPKRRQKRGTDSGFRGGAGAAQPSSNPERQGGTGPPPRRTTADLRHSPGTRRRGGRGLPVGRASGRRAGKPEAVIVKLVGPLDQLVRDVLGLGRGGKLFQLGRVRDVGQHGSHAGP